MYSNGSQYWLKTVIGSPPMNLMAGTLSDGSIVTAGGWRIPLPSTLGRVDGDVTVGLRPEGIEIVADGDPDSHPAEVIAVEPFGSEVIVDARIGDQSVKVRTGPGVRPAPGRNIALRADPAAVRLFDRATGAALA